MTGAMKATNLFCSSGNIFFSLIFYCCFALMLISIPLGNVAKMQTNEQTLVRLPAISGMHFLSFQGTERGNELTHCYAGSKLELCIKGKN